MNDRVRPKPAWMDRPRPPPWLPAPYHSDDVAALKAVWNGEGSPQQQRLALQWIIIHACQYGEISFRSDADGGERDTAFAQGRFFVGQQIQKLIGLEHRLIAKLREQENAGSSTDDTRTDPLADPRLKPGHRRPDTKHDRSGS